MTQEPNLSPEGIQEPGFVAKPPAATVGRISLYLRELQRLEDNGVASVNSRELAGCLNLSADVVRRDLSMIGSVGRRGVGYEVAALANRLRSVLGSDTAWKVALIGTGSLGHALLRYQGFQRLGFRLVAAFDNDPNRVGEQIGGVRIGHTSGMKAAFKKLKPQLAILAVPAEVAADVANDLAACGIAGILNFAPTALKLPAGIGVVNVDLASELQRLAFHVNQRLRESEGGEEKEKK